MLHAGCSATRSSSSSSPEASTSPTSPTSADHPPSPSKSPSGGPHANADATPARVPSGSRTTTATNGTSATKPASTTSTPSAPTTTGSRPPKAGPSSKAPGNERWSHPTTPATPRTSPRNDALRGDGGSVCVRGATGAGMFFAMNARDVCRRACGSRGRHLDLVVLADGEELLVALAVPHDDLRRILCQRRADRLRVRRRVRDREGCAPTVERGESAGERSRVHRVVAHDALRPTVRVTARNQRQQDENACEERDDEEATAHDDYDAAKGNPVPSAVEARVHGAYELFAAGVALGVETQLVHHVAEAESGVGIGEGERSARARVAEGGRTVRGAERAPEHEAVAEARVGHEHRVLAARLLDRRGGHRRGQQRAHAVDVADARRVEPCQRPCVADPVRRRQLRRAQRGRVPHVVVSEEVGRVREHLREQQVAAELLEELAEVVLRHHQPGDARFDVLGQAYPEVEVERCRDLL